MESFPVASRRPRGGGAAKTEMGSVGNGVLWHREGRAEAGQQRPRWASLGTEMLRHKLLWLREGRAAKTEMFLVGKRDALASRRPRGGGAAMTEVGPIGIRVVVTSGAVVSRRPRAGGESSSG